MISFLTDPLACCPSTHLPVSGGELAGTTKVQHNNLQDRTEQRSGGLQLYILLFIFGGGNSEVHFRKRPPRRGRNPCVFVRLSQSFFFCGCWQAVRTDLKVEFEQQGKGFGNFRGFCLGRLKRSVLRNARRPSGHEAREQPSTSGHGSCCAELSR
jgi:hypothetical protein